MADTNQENFYIEAGAPFGGYIPAWYGNNDIFIGNKNQFSAMKNMDFRDPNYFQPGPDSVSMSAVAAMTTKINDITKTVASANVAFAVGGAKLYKLSKNGFNTTNWPKTIVNSALSNIDAVSVVLFQGAIYEFYNHSTGGDIEMTTLAGVQDPDYGSTIPAGADTLENAPHPAIVAADILLFGNKNYVGLFDGTTIDVGGGTIPVGTATHALDFKSGSVVSCLAYTGGWAYVGVNYPDVSGANANDAAIYLWDTLSESWETDITFRGRIGAMLTDNGVVYVWYEEEHADGGYKFGYVNGGQVTEIESYAGSMPSYNQVTKHGGFIQWVSDGKVMTWGTKNKKVVAPVLFNLMDGKWSTVDAIGNPFGELLIASRSGTSYDLSKNSGIDTGANAYTLSFDVTNGQKHGIIDQVQIETYPLTESAKVDIAIIPDMNVANSSLVGTMGQQLDGTGTIRKMFDPSVECDNFKLKFSYSGSSTANPVKVRKFKIFGHYVK